MTEHPIPVSREVFSEAALSSGTDKGGFHAYQRFYPFFLSQIDRCGSFTIVEIGFGNGASIPLWKNLFPNAFILCIDKDIEEEGDGYAVRKADQADPSSILAVVKDYSSSIQLVIDDGSHHPRHQISSFSLLFHEALEPGGIYVIEDIETSYWLAGSLYGNELRYGLFCRWSTIEILKLASDYINRLFLSSEDKNLLEYSLMIGGLPPETAQEIAMVSFGQNLAVICKAKTEDKDYSSRSYPYSNFTERC